MTYKVYNYFKNYFFFLLLIFSLNLINPLHLIDHYYLCGSFEALFIALFIASDPFCPEPDTKKLLKQYFSPFTYIENIDSYFIVAF